MLRINQQFGCGYNPQFMYKVMSLNHPESLGSQVGETQNLSMTAA